MEAGTAGAVEDEDGVMLEWMLAWGFSEVEVEGIGVRLRWVDILVVWSDWR